MASGTELQILRIIRGEGGETTPGLVSRKLGSSWGIDYIRLLCNSLGRDDYIDVLKSGKLIITAKGMQAVGDK